MHQTFNHAYIWALLFRIDSLLHNNSCNVHNVLIYMQLTRIGRDAVLYVESLIESIMGGLEGLINILDSEGGFGSLETQVLACLFILVTQVSINE